MSQMLQRYGIWLADYYLLSTVLLAGALASLAAFAQPARRMAVVKSSIVALLVLAMLCALPRLSVVHLSSALQTATTADNMQPVAVLLPGKIVDGEAEEVVAPENRAQTELATRANAAPAKGTSFQLSSTEILPSICLVGSIASAGWLCLGWFASQRLLQTARPVSTSLTSTLQNLPELGARASRVRIMTHDRIQVAAAVGIWRPTILLPAGWLQSQSPRQLLTALAHEMRHVTNHDLAWVSAARVLMLALWANPLFWIMKRRLRLDQELLADAAAAEIIGRQQYAEQLVTWARNLGARPAFRVAAAVGLWESPSQLRRRIALLLNDRIMVLRSCPPSWKFASAATIAVATLTLSSVTLQPQVAAQAHLVPSAAGKVKSTFAADTRDDKERTPTVLSYGDGKPDGKKSYGGSGFMIEFEMPEGVTKVKGIRIHGSRYGLPQAPNEDFEITFLSEKRDEVLHTESAPYKLFKRGKENWVRIPFKEEVELPKKFWIALDFNAEQTKGVYVSYDTSTKGEHSRVGLAGDENEPKKTDFAGDWMIQVLLAMPRK